MVARTENQPDPPPMSIPPVAFAELLRAVGVEWRHLSTISYDREKSVLTVSRLRVNGMGFTQEDRRGDPLVETFDVVVGT